jgi:NAD-dependent dihydropyrimidine dehydrogenase PreA subunit
MSDKVTVILCQARDADAGRRALEQELAATLAQLPNIEVSVLPPLYDLAPSGPGMRHLQSVSGELVVLCWLSPRAVYWVLRANGIEGRMGGTANFPAQEQAVGDRTLWCIDLRGQDTASVLRPLEQIAARSVGLQPAQPAAPTTAPSIAAPPRIVDAPLARWYPVVDYECCVNCLECLNFCLFGVYGLDDAGKVFVEQPDACRDGCPACARICPAGAILFPAHDDPAIAGDDVGSAIVTPPDTQNLAEAERQSAVSQSTQGAHRKEGESATDGLDRLVDELGEATL